jgi:biotin carboxyl carrier protein
MKARFLIQVDGHGAPMEVEAEALTATRYRVVLDGQEHVVERRSTPSGGGPPVLLRQGSASAKAASHAGAASWAGQGTQVQRVQLDGRLPAVQATVGELTFSVRTEDAQRQRALGKGGKAAAAGPLTVRAPMPGRVVKLLVKPGDKVEPGQGLVIVEAMKMENELKAPQAGTVKELSVAEGQNVESGASLLVLEV